MSIEIIRPRSGTQSVLTVWRLEYMEDGWESTLEAFDAVSVKILDGHRVFRAKSAEAILDAASVSGCSLHGWGYHYCRNIEEAEREGKSAAKMANKLGLHSYWMNVEKHWGGTSGQPHTEDPPAAAIAFVTAFKQHSHAKLFFNGFSWRHTSKDAGLRPLCTEEVIEAFDAFGPMCYGTTRKTIARKWRGRSRRVPDGVSWAPMVGTGRVDHRGNVWGFADDGGGHPGIITLNKECPADIVAFFYGGGCQGMLTKGNDHNPPLPEVAEMLRGL
jgi:hypothetical protein